DPSSQQACTIGGNIATNSGGPHTLKYGVTVNHVLGLEVVLPDGEIVWLGGRTRDALGYDLAGVFVGSEGTFGIAPKIVVRILKKPQAVKTVLAVFDRIEQASAAVSAIIAAGLVPAAVEMIDQLTIQAVEDAFGCGYPRDAAAALLIELDGLAVGMEAQAERIVAACRETGAREIRTARTESERLLLWKGRKSAFGAYGRISPAYMVMDGVMPFIFSAADLAFMHRLKSAFNPTGLCNPGKIFPTKKSCGEVGPVAYRPHPIEEKGLAQRFSRGRSEGSVPGALREQLSAAVAPANVPPGVGRSPTVPEARTPAP